MSALQNVLYLGRIVVADGYKLDPKNIKSVTELVKQKLKILGEVRRLLEMAGYFRKYVADFSKKRHYYITCWKKHWEQDFFKVIHHLSPGRNIKTH